MSLEQDIHELRQLGLSFSIIGSRVGLSKDQAQKRYQKFLLENPLPHTPTPEGDWSSLEGDRSFRGGLVERATPPYPPRLRILSHQ